MRLKIINKTSQSIDAFVVFRSVGAGYFSKKLADEMQLNHGDFFNVLNDEDAPLDYYLVKASAGVAVKQYADNKNKKFRQFHARTLARDFGRVFGIDHKNVKIAAGPKVNIDGVIVWPLITAGLNGIKNTFA